MWRKVRKDRWLEDRDASNDDDVKKAAEDMMLRPTETGLSLYKVDTEQEAAKVAAYFVFTRRKPKAPEPIDFLLIPSQCFREVGVRPRLVPDDHLHPFLSERHCEAEGLDYAGSIRLTKSILGNPARTVKRLKPSELVIILPDLIAEDPSLQGNIGGDWANKILRTN